MHPIAVYFHASHAEICVETSIKLKRMRVHAKSFNAFVDCLEYLLVCDMSVRLCTHLCTIVCVCPPYWEVARLYCDLASAASRTRCAVHNYRSSRQRSPRYSDLSPERTDGKREREMAHHSNPDFYPSSTSPLVPHAQSEQRLTMYSVSLLGSEQSVGPQLNTSPFEQEGRLGLLSGRWDYKRKVSSVP